MKQVRVQPVDTYVRPDTTELNNLSQRQRQVTGAFEQLGVMFKQERQRELEDIKEERVHREKLEANAASAKIELAEKYLRDSRNQNMTDEELRAHESMDVVRSALDGMSNAKHREALTQHVSQMLASVSQQHSIQRQKVADLTAYGSVIGGLLDREDGYSAAQVNQLVTENKRLLGNEAVVEMAGVAVKAEELPAIEALLTRDDLTPKTLAYLEAARDGILTARAKAEKKDKTGLYFALDQAKNVEDRGERLTALADVVNQFSGKMDTKMYEGMLSDMAILQEELKTEDFVKLNLANFTTRELAESLPEGYRSLSHGEIKKIHNNEWRQAMAEGRMADVIYLMRDPTDMPTAAKQFFGGFLSDLMQADPANVSEELSKTFDLARQIDAKLGAQHMGTVLNEEPYADFQFFSGIAAQQGIEGAVNALKEYKQDTVHGRPQLPKGFATMKRDIVTDVAEELDIEDEAYVNQVLTPFFKRWGVQGLTQERMLERATQIMTDSTWDGIPNGTNAFKAFHAMRQGTHTVKYEETERELFDTAIASYTEGFKAEYEGLSEELEIRVVPTAPNFIQFISPNGKIIPKSIVSLEDLVQRAKDNTVSTMDKAIQNLRNRDIRAKWEEENKDKGHPIYANSMGIGGMIRGLIDD